MIETPTRVLKSPTPTAPTSPLVNPTTPSLAPTQPTTPGRPSMAIRRGSNPSKSILLRIRLYPYVETGAQSTMLDVTSDNYFSEVLDLICKKLHLDKSLYVLRLPGTSLMIPPSRRVESLQGRTELELIRKNALEAMTAGGSAAGTPTNSGTSRTLLFREQADLVTGTGHKKRKKLLLDSNLGDQSDLITNASYQVFPPHLPCLFRVPQLRYVISISSLCFPPANVQKYIVWRRQPIFGRHERVLAIDGDYIHLMPSDQKTMYEPGNPKTSSIFIGAILRAKQSRKIPQNFKVSHISHTQAERRSWC
jgi:target of rapamycin complex 2 subunit MAPKAP1